MKTYTVHEWGFESRIIKAKNKENAKKQYIKKYGWYGNSISIFERRKK